MADALQVLIVEDNTDLGSMLVEYLQEVGHKAETVASAKDAIALLEKSGQFDVLMTDVRLPGMSGIALAEEAVARWPRIGIVISSGFGDALDLQFFPASLIPVVVLVPKPCNLPQLPQMLAAAAVKANPR